MKKDYKKILATLADNFSDDPGAVRTAIRFIVKKFSGFESDRESDKKDTDSRIDSSVKKIEDAIKASNKAILREFSDRLDKRAREILHAVSEDDTMKEWKKEIDTLVRKLDTELRQRLDSLSNRRGGSGGGIINGGAGRAVYFNGVYPNYYSDLNFIAGSGAIITATPNEVTQRVDVTLTSTGSFQGLQEKTTTTPNGSQQTFAFAHAPGIIVWNGAIQFLGTDYTVSGDNITFLTGIPQTGDIILNIYA